MANSIPVSSVETAAKRQMSAHEDRKLLDAARELRRRARARTHFLDFMKYVWWMPQPFCEGLHTRIIAARIDQAVEDLLDGYDTFLAIKTHFRAGKSDMVSCALPPYMAGRLAFMQPDMMFTGYGANLVHKFSRKARNIVQSPQYHKLFPNVRLSVKKRTDALWRTDYYDQVKKEWQESTGDIVSTGLTGGLTGSGYVIGVVDDFFKNRKEAESIVYRERVWDAIVNEFLTRRAPVSITIISATPWHMDDPFGRIKKQIKEDPDFPMFEFMKFSAKGPAYACGKKIKYKSRFLFSERISDNWYEGQYAALGRYASAGLLDCSPTVLKGNLFDIDRIKYHKNDKSFPTNSRYVRFWDLASTEKQVGKTDPDYTAGALVCVTFKTVGDLRIPHLWIKDIVAGQWAAPKRDRIIQATALNDGASVYQVQESVGGYKDASTRLADVLAGIICVREWTPIGKGDKVVRAENVEPIFEAGNVHVIVNNKWTDLWLQQVKEFPKGSHDDLVDAVVGAYMFLKEGQICFPFPRNKIGV